MKVRFKRLVDGAILPVYGSADAGALDLALPKNGSPIILHHGETVVIPLGYQVEIPSGHIGKIKARSSMWSKGWRVSGFIDPDFRGELKLMIQAPNLHSGVNSVSPFLLNPGERVAQILIEQTLFIEPEWADELTSTDRGEGGFGSTNR